MPGCYGNEQGLTYRTAWFGIRPVTRSTVCAKCDFYPPPPRTRSFLPLRTRPPIPRPPGGEKVYRARGPPLLIQESQACPLHAAKCRVIGGGSRPQPQVHSCAGALGLSQTSTPRQWRWQPSILMARPGQSRTAGSRSRSLPRAPRCTHTSAASSLLPPNYLPITSQLPPMHLPCTTCSRSEWLFSAFYLSGHLFYGRALINPSRLRARGLNWVPLCMLMSTLPGVASDF